MLRQGTQIEQALRFFHEKKEEDERTITTLKGSLAFVEDVCR